MKRITLFLIGSIYCLNLQATITYEQAKTNSNSVRSQLQIRYLATSNLIEKNATLSQAASSLHQLLIKQLFPPWYGTEWDYNGTSQIPGQGTIACGYFITTLLRDAGIKVERSLLAQQASENIIKSLVSAKSIKRFSNSRFKDFLNTINQWGNGIYIVGLDNHVGFLSVEKEQTFFIHSTFLGTRNVMKEIASQSVILAASQYKVVGKLNDKKFIKKWLVQEKFPTLR